jgi:guanine nucleotide-binding protein subunit alpha
MGICAAKNPASDAKLKEEKQKSKDLEKQIVADQRADQQVNKLLLLGAGESGKSTLFKQMITIYGKGFSLEDRKEYIHVVFSNILLSVKTLCDQSDKLAQRGIQGTKVTPKNVASKKIY